jgi:hypothetical protein
VTAPTLPTSADDIDRAWIAAALAAGGLRTGATVARVNVGPLDSAAVGLIGQLVHCQVEWTGASDGDDLPTSIVIKLPSTNDGNRALALAMGYYDAEHHFYRDFAARSGIRTPRCWYTDGDADAGLYALLIEDVGHLDVVDQSVGLDAATAESVLRHAARLHGRNWLDEDLVGLPWLPDGYGEALRVYGLLMNDSWPAWSAAVRGVIDPADLDLAERFVTNYDPLVDAVADEPWTLVHRDFRVLETDVRRSAQERLLRGYRDALVVAGGPTYDDDRFARLLRINGLFCLIVPILGGGSVLDAKDERGEELIATMLKRTFELLHDLDAGRELPA